MALAIGKRKRQDDIEDDDALSESDGQNARALFQRAFEAKFKPLDKRVNKSDVGRQDDAESDEIDNEDRQSSWDGLSSDDDAAVEVVEHERDFIPDQKQHMTKKKAFMSSRPPINDQRSVSKSVKNGEPRDEDDLKEATNLKHDLALQRLLKESHLFDPSTFKGPSNSPEGKGRLEALDLRLQGLGAKRKLREQSQMPLSHRKGIRAKAASREANRRKEAAENGVILEKVWNAAKSERRRDRGIAAPSIGKFKGGTLRLSSRDVRSIEKPKQAFAGQKRRR